jgi:AAA family ATP:ADP antiporter
MRQLNWKQKAKSLVPIKRDEINQVALLFAYNFLIIASHIIVKSIRDALFIHRVGASKLPYVYIGIALIAGIVVQGYSRLARLTRRNRMIIGSNLFFISNILAFWWLFHYDWDWLSYALYIWAGIFSAISVAQFLLVANDIFNPRQAKRLFGYILGGGTLGGLLAGVVSRGIVNTIGTENLFLITVAQLLGCTIIMRWITLQEPAAAKRGTARTTSSDQDTAGAFASILKSKHLLLLATIISITVVAQTLIDFQFKNIIQQNYETKDALTGFFGSYYAYINIMIILFQLLVTGRVLKRFGVGVALLVMPAALFLGSGITLFYPVLWAAIFVKSCDDVFSFSVNKWSTEILWIPIPASIKQRAKIFIDVVVERISRGIGGLLLLLLIMVASPGIRQLSIPTLVMLIGWVFLCVRIHKEYVVSIESTLQKQSLDLDNIAVDLSDSSTINLLFPLLDSKNERQVAYALELLQDMKNPEAAERIQQLCHHPSPEVRTRALRILSGIGDPEFVSQIEPLLKDGDEEVRTEAMHYICTYGEAEYNQKLQSFLVHSDYRMKSAAIACIAQYGGEKERALITRQLIDQMLSERGEYRKLARLGAAEALGVMEQGSDVRQYLLELFDDEDVDVVKQAIRSAGRIKCPELVPVLLERLDNPAIKVPVREALAACGQGILDTLVSKMTDQRTPISIRRQIPKVISMIPHQDSVDALLEHLDQDEMDMRYKMIRALSEIREVHSNVHFDSNLVESHITEHIKEYYRLSIMLDAQNGNDSYLLRRALKERLELLEHMIFRLLGLIHTPESMRNAYRGVISHNARVRANAVELLDNVLNRNVKRMFFPIVDDSPRTGFMQKAYDLWAMESITDKEALTLLISSRDNWLKACALYTAGEKRVIEVQEYVRQACGSSNILVRESAELAWKKLGLGKD